MKIQFDEKQAASKLNCLRIELNSKPDLLAKSIDNDKTLVLVVDMIEGFCKRGALASPRSCAAISPIKTMLEKLPNAKKVFIRDVHTKDSIEFKSFPPHCDNKGESALVKELAGFKGIDLPKNSTNAFFTLIKKMPNLSEFTNIILIGVCTDICVMQLGLTIKTYFNETNTASNIMLFTECVDTFDAPWHDAELSNLFALKFLEQAGITLFRRLN